MRANGQNKPTRENILALKKEQKSRPSAKVWKTKDATKNRRVVQKNPRKKTATTNNKNYNNKLQETVAQNTHVVAQQSGSTGKPLQHSYVCAYVAECNKEAWLPLYSEITHQQTWVNIKFARRKKRDACCPEVLSRQSVQKNVPSVAMGGAFNRDETLTQMSLMLCNCWGKTQRAAFIIGTKNIPTGSECDFLSFFFDSSSVTACKDLPSR